LDDNLPLEAMKRELAAASPQLLNNDDLLRGVLSGCGDCIKILDLDGRMQFMSEGGKRIMEVEDFSALKGCPWPDLWAGEGNAQAIEAVATARDGRTARFRNAADTAKGTPRYWDVQVSPIADGDGRTTHLLSISRDITEEWNAAQAQAANLERQKFLTQELTHRVKNALATVMAIARQTFKDEAHKAPRDIFSGRIQTLSDAYNILTEASWASGSIKRVVESALTPYRTGQERFTLSGPDFEITPNQALTLALAINELATNAMKYGALSVAHGHVAVNWTIMSAGTGSLLRFEWRETDGPPVVTPTRSGFGSRLIKTMLPGDFGGSVHLRYDPAGLVCVMEAPIKQ
jgi:PAS domain S-box-containing protein